MSENVTGPPASGLASDLSYWLSYRKGATDRYLPAAIWAKLLYHKPPYWYTFAFTLNPQQTLEFLQTARENTWLVSIAGDSNQNAGYQARVLHARKKAFFQRLFADQANFAGTGSERYHIRTPYRVRKGDSIIVQIKNVATVQISGQVVIEGVEDVKP